MLSEMSDYENEKLMGTNKGPSSRGKSQKEEVAPIAVASLESQSPQEKVFHTYRRRNKVKDRISRFLSSPLARRWCAFEWLYSTVDAQWFEKNEYVEYLNYVTLDILPRRLTRSEWGIIHCALGRPRGDPTTNICRVQFDWPEKRDENIMDINCMLQVMAYNVLSALQKSDESSDMLSHMIELLNSLLQEANSMVTKEFREWNNTASSLETDCSLADTDKPPTSTNLKLEVTDSKPVILSASIHLPVELISSCLATLVDDTELFGAQVPTRGRGQKTAFGIEKLTSCLPGESSLLPTIKT